MSTTLAAIAARWLNIAQYWLLPGTCVLCHAPSGQRLDLCEHCHAQLRYIDQACERCALPLPASATSLEGCSLCGYCLQHAAPFRHAVAPLLWTEPASTLISQFKYQARLPPGRVLGNLLVHELRLHYTDRVLPGLVVPVPLHPAKLRRRGYNQSLLLARQLATALALPCAPTLLRRVRDTPQQQGLSREERRQNLKGAFVLDPHQMAQFRGLHSIALVDDVVTTQSTAREVAAVLQQGWLPAPEIHLWALARA